MNFVISGSTAKTKTKTRALRFFPNPDNLYNIVFTKEG